MTERNRTTVNLTPVKERIETLRSDNAWNALPLSKKVVLLLEEYLELLEKSEEFDQQEPQSKDGELALSCWQKIVQGKAPNQPEIIKLATALNVDSTNLQQKINQLRELFSDT
ncbi:MAG: hypothetical protein F6K36_08735 [Symploca sp. SIO3C6]|uniref:HTH cro/C1-type domain-containing protein n=1 Tax=Symploca sp. SIO1C4 TaxID=2607765 RepID=A0A6B3NHM6_9CYAN|nr:hypothetical protein [Symploca sp. SIO3C6]NER31257.1 hypothetical protein [Symploca sp. SIO1C4]